MILLTTPGTDNISARLTLKNIEYFVNFETSIATKLLPSLAHFYWSTSRRITSAQSFVVKLFEVGIIFGQLFGYERRYSYLTAFVDAGWKGVFIEAFHSLN